MPPPPLHPADLGLILSYKCQCACAHCLYNCGPGWRDWMAPEDLPLAFQAMLAWEQPFQVHLTGGEPFLNFPLLLQAAQIGTELGVPCYAETNAGWCVREELALQRFEALRQAGLGAVLISCSPFHAEHIPPRRTWLAIQAAIEVFGPQGVIVYLPDWLETVSRFGLEEATPLEAYSKTYGRREAGRLFWEGYGLISGGRAGYRLGDLTPRRPAGRFQGQSCAADILYAHHSHFDLYGNYISGFCGGLAVGSWRDLPRLLDDFAAGRYPPLIAALVESGPFGLFEMALREHGYVPLTGGYAGKCHLCADVRRHLASQARQAAYPELNPKSFYEGF